MLINFSIQNFGSIKDKQTLSFEADKSKHLEDYYVIHKNGLRLLKLGLIYGANASGKTTILNALDFLRTLVLSPKSQKTETFDFEPFLFDENTPKQNTIFEIEFIQNNVRYLYEVELNTNAVVREELLAYNPNKSNVFSRTTDLENQVTKIKFGNKIKIDKITEQQFENITLWNNTVLGGFLKINFFAKELRDTADWFKGYLKKTIESHAELESMTSSKLLESEVTTHSILQILQQADFNISNIILNEEIEVLTNEEMAVLKRTEKRRIDNEEFGGYPFKTLPNNKILSIGYLEFEHSVGNKKYNLKFEQESQGTQRYYGFAGLLSLLITDSTMYSIDEIESSLHPDLFQHFLLSFLVNSKESQILATTHNREILNNKDIFRNDAIWITDKDNEDCATELYSLADFDTSVIRDTTNVLNAYKLGKLGGTPNLGDYYIDVEDYEDE